MKKQIINLLLIFGLATGLFSQNHDIQWIQADVPASIMDFRNDTISFHYLSDTIPAFLSTANICDKNGNFLFFTNGIYVRDRFGNKMPNGDSLSFNNQEYYAAVTTSGAPNDQSVMILPKPGSSTIYYIFHFLPIDTIFTIAGRTYLQPINFFYSIVDMTQNFGLGDVVQKNKKLPIPGVQSASRMTAVRHGNGRDWWIVRHGFGDNTYIKYLFTEDTILGPFIQQIGPSFNQNSIVINYDGTSVFNLEGNKMATANWLGPTVVLDFDRCNGVFSNPFIINNHFRDTTLLSAIGLSFSPNGRFLYVNTIYDLNQYDLEATTPNDSVLLYSVDSSDQFFLHSSRLAPNGKIYIATWHGGTGYLHVINNPNQLGLASNFEFQGQQCLTLNTWNLPNMLNYKLGALINSACDSLINMVNDVAPDDIILQLYPNPAQTTVTVRSNGFYVNAITIYDIHGNMHKKIIEPVNNVVDISELSAGVYIAQVQIVYGREILTRNLRWIKL